MSRIALDLKKFKHVKSDDNSTTLQHSDGHQLTLAHKSLSPEFQEQLSALPKLDKKEFYRGGRATTKLPPREDIDYEKRAEESNANLKKLQADPSSAPVYNTDDPSGSQTHASHAKGGKVQKYGFGDTVQKFLAPDFYKAQQDKEASTTTRIPQDNTAGPTAARPDAKAKGGEVSQQGRDVKNKDYENAKKEAKGRAQFEREAVKPRLKGLANGGEISPFNEGGQANAANNAGLPCLNPNCKSQGRPHPNCRCYSSMAEGGKVEHVCSSGNKHYPDCEHYKNDNQDLGHLTAAEESKYARSKEPQRKMYADPQEEVSQDDSAPITDADIQGKPPQQALPVQMGPDQDQQGLQTEAPPSSTEDNMTPIPQPRIPTDEETDADMEKEAAQNEPKETEVPVSQELNQEAVNYGNDLALGHITPKTYSDLFHYKGGDASKGETSTLSKIGMIFGALLGGGGAGLTHQPNKMFEMMDNVIKNDLQGQEKSAANAQNFLRMAQENEVRKAQIKQAGALTAQAHAEAMAKAQATAYSAQLQSTFHDLVMKTSDTMPEGPQKEKAKLQLGALYRGMSDKIMNANDLAEGAIQNVRLFTGQSNVGQKGAVGNTNGKIPDPKAFADQQNFLRMQGPEGIMKAQDNESKYVPGYPLSTLPVDKDVRNKLVAHDKFDKAATDLYSLVKNVKGSIQQANPVVRANAAQQAMILQSLFREGTLGTVYREGEQPLLDKAIRGQPLDLAGYFTELPKLKGLIDSNQKFKNIEAKNAGIPINSKQAPKSAAPAAASGIKEGTTGTHSNGRATIYKNGEWKYK